MVRKWNMARPLRIAFPGAFYHVTTRGHERKAVFKSIRDRQKFLAARNIKLELEKGRKLRGKIERFEKRLFLSNVEI
jgi:hypothetical protein